MTEADVRRLLAEKKIRTVRPDPETAQVELDVARRHIASAEKIMDDDPTLAFTALYDAIRKAIATAFSEMVQSLNQTLNYSVSWRGLKWRLEALRTGKGILELVRAKGLLTEEQIASILDPAAMTGLRQPS